MLGRSSLPRFSYCLKEADHKELDTKPLASFPLAEMHSVMRHKRSASDITWETEELHRVKKKPKIDAHSIQAFIVTKAVHTWQGLIYHINSPAARKTISAWRQEGLGSAQGSPFERAIDNRGRKAVEDLIKQAWEKEAAKSLGDGRPEPPGISLDEYKLLEASDI